MTLSVKEIMENSKHQEEYASLRPADRVLVKSAPGQNGVLAPTNVGKVEYRQE